MSDFQNTVSSNIMPRPPARRHEERSFNRRKLESPRNFIQGYHNQNYVRRYNSYSRNDRDWGHQYQRYHTRERKKYLWKKKQPSRPSSPVQGSEEYLNRKIQETSALVMRHLFMPDDSTNNLKSTQCSRTEEPSKTDDLETHFNTPTQSSLTRKKNKDHPQPKFNVEEIQEKIISHITKLNEGKKKNLINSTTSYLDTAFERIQKQNRINISRALRDMCLPNISRDQTQKSGNLINSIIPDIGINIGDLPQDVIQELCSKIKVEVDEDNFMELHNASVKLDSYDEEERKFSNYLSQICIPDVPTADVEKSANNDDEGTLILNELPPSQSLEQTDVFHDSDVNVSHVIERLNNQPDVTNIKKENNEGIEYVGVRNSFESSPQLFSGLTSEYNPDIKEEKISIHDNFLSADVATQTYVLRQDISTQAENSPEDCLNELLEHFNKNKPKTLKDAVERMYSVDDFIERLTQYRKSIFQAYAQKQTIPKRLPLQKEDTSSQDKRVIRRQKPTTNNTTVLKTNSTRLKQFTSFGSNASNANIALQSGSKPQRKRKVPIRLRENFVKPRKRVNKDSESDAPVLNNVVANISPPVNRILDLPKIMDKILVIKIFNDMICAASETGKVFICNKNNGQLIEELKVSSSQVTALSFNNTNKVNQMYVGLFEEILKVYDIDTRALLKSLNLKDRVSCLENKWGHLFIGGRGGTLTRYSIKKQKFEFEDSVYQGDAIFILIAAQEGARKVLLVGARKQPVCIKDAMSGLYIRVLENNFTPIVHCMLLENHFVYCGTNTDSILVYSFHNGNLLHDYCDHTNNSIMDPAIRLRGVSCLKALDNLLFAACHDGYIYVYDTKSNKYLNCMLGPGGSVLSMEILENQIIVGTKTFHFKSIPIPQFILDCKKK